MCFQITTKTPKENLLAICLHFTSSIFLCYCLLQSPSAYIRIRCMCNIYWFKIFCVCNLCKRHVIHMQYTYHFKINSKLMFYFHITSVMQLKVQNKAFQSLITIKVTMLISEHCDSSNLSFGFLVVVTSLWNTKYFFK